MTDHGITVVELSVGLLLLVIYLVVTLSKGRTPELSKCLACFLTGAGLVVGPLLGCCGFGVASAQTVLRPEHFVVAGIAIVYVAIAGIVEAFK